jgi:hypothetical protein
MNTKKLLITIAIALAIALVIAFGGYLLGIEPSTTTLIIIAAIGIYLGIQGLDIFPKKK